MKPGILIILLYLLCNITVNGQIKYGFDLSLTSSTFINISPDTLESFGNSGAIFSQKPSCRINPAFLIRKELNNNLSFEGGIGYHAIKHKLHQRFYHELGNFNVDDTFYMSLHYIQIPWSLYYGLQLNEKSKLLFSGTIKYKIIISQKDNGDDLIFEAVWLPEVRYMPLVITPGIAIALQKNFPNGSTFEIGLFGNIDATPVVLARWGFYDNLHSARFLQLGTNIKFFLNR